MRDIAAIITVAEILLWLTVFYLLVRRVVHSRSAAYSYACVGLFAALSVLLQALVECRCWPYSWILDVVILPGAGLVLARERTTLREDFRDAVNRFAESPFQALLFAGVLGYLFLQAILLPPVNGDSLAYNLTRVLIFQRENTLWPYQNTSCLHQVVFPYGYDILHLAFLRFCSDFGLGLFGFLSYTVVLASTYSAAQQQLGVRSLSLLTSLIVGSLAGLVLQATNTKNDLPCAALASVIFLATLNWRKAPSPIHVMVILTCVLFGLTIKSYFVLFAAPYVLISAVLLFRNPTALVSLARDTRELARSLLARYLLILLVLSGGAFYARCGVRYGHPFGPADFRTQHVNPGGITGGALNGVRYTAQMIGWPKILGGDRLTTLHNRLLGAWRNCGVAPGQTVDLAGPQRSILPHEDLTWYGPLGLLLVVPAVIVGLRAGGMVRVVSATLLCFSGLICLTVGWMPWNARFFAIPFAASGLCVASLLGRVRHRGPVSRVLYVVSVLLLLETVAMNISKPLVDVYGVAAVLEKKTGLRLLKAPAAVDESRPLAIPAWWSRVRKRTLSYDELFGNQFVSRCFMSIRNSDKLLVVSRGGPLFPFLLKRNDLAVVIRADLKDPASMEQAAAGSSCDELLCLDRVPIEQFKVYHVIGQGNLMNENTQFAVLLSRHVR